MNLQEYESVKDLTYVEYCDYLQKKYGKSKYNYMSENFVKIPKVTRTSEGLFVHHKYENKTILLTNQAIAKHQPYEYQLAENLAYCDFLEHLLLHVLICEYPENTLPQFIVGIGGAINFIIPELNDLYSGCPVAPNWKMTCFNKVKQDQDCYITIVNRLIKNSHNYPLFDLSKILLGSWNAPLNHWDVNKNLPLTSKFNTCGLVSN